MDVPSECTCHCGQVIPLKFAVRCSKSKKCHDYYSIYCQNEECHTRFCSFHDTTCWNGHLPRSHKEAAFHVPVGITVQHLFIRNVFHTEVDVQRLRQLHEQDASARWFNIRHRSSQPVLSVYDRFGPLCKSLNGSDSDSGSAFPSFVSFIGKSGVGKSTLARAMLLLGSHHMRQNPTSREGFDVAANQTNIETFSNALSSLPEAPVTRSGHADHAADPTTLGVHLYKDGSETPGSEDKSNDFMLFADCEGLFAGVAQTVAEKLTARTGEQSVREPVNDRNLLYSEPITAPGYRQHGQRGAELFYARFLYAISDVVVFVTNEDQTIAHLLVSVLEWAAAAVSHSVNNPSRKTLIIVKNGALVRSKNTQELSDDSSLAKSYLEGRTILWKESPILQRFVREYNSKQDAFSNHIYENRDLYNVLFDKIVCCSIPNVEHIEENRDEVMFNQYMRLRTQIQEASQEARRLRSTGWMKYNASSLSQILFAAFEHFRTSDGPFNFNEAARIGKPNPQSFSNHIANFLRLALESKGLSSSSDKTGAMIADALALSFAVWSMRSLVRVVNPGHLFYADTTAENGSISMAECCRLASEEYDEKYQECGYKFSGNSNELCTNGPAANHGRLHLSKMRKQADGPFTPRRSYPSNLTESVRDRFLEQYKILVTDDKTGHPSTAKPVASKIRRVRVSIMEKYAPQWRSVTSNTTCLACLQEVPENVLSCGHGYCVQCVRELGKVSDTFESAWIFEVCPLCDMKTGENYSHLIRMKPRCAGARILTLDGGGIRGIIELALIRGIEQRLGLDIPFRDYFDLIMGTSTGGIIALAIAMGDEKENAQATTLPQASSSFASTQTTTLTKAFTSFASKTFAHPRAGPLLTKIGLGHFMTSVVMTFGLYQALFDSAPLQSGLKDFFGEHTSLFGSARTRNHECSTRVAVIATKEFGKRHHLISSYNRPSLKACSDFEREDDERKGMKIWEAGLATSAAPFYLPPFKKLETNTVYFDGALHMNCPAPAAIEEMRRLWPEESASLDFLLSIGTGIQDSEVKIPKAIRIGGFAEICRSFHSKLDSENQWQEFFASGAAASMRGRLHRLNPFIDESLQKVTLWQWDKMAKLEAMVARQMNEAEWKSRIDTATDALLASLFYFEPDPSEPLSTNNLTPNGTRHLNMDIAIGGTVRTRLRHHSVELSRLLDRVSGMFYTKIPTWSSYRSHASQLQQERWMDIVPFVAVRDRVKSCPFRVPVRLESSERELLVLAVRFKGSSSTIPISGFPVLIDDLHRRARLWD